MADLNQGAVTRDKNGKPFGDARVAPAFAEFFIDDGTGFVSGATPTNQIVAAAPMKVGRKNHVGTDVAERTATVTGQFTVQRRGDYLITGHGTWLGGNASVMKIEVFKNAAVVADAAGFPGGSIRCEDKMQATAAQTSWQIPACLLPDLREGDLVDVRVTGSVGTVTIKQMRLLLLQLGDADAPVFA